MGSCPFWFPAILAHKYCCCCSLRFGKLNSRTRLNINQHMHPYCLSWASWACDRLLNVPWRWSQTIFDVQSTRTRLHLPKISVAQNSRGENVAAARSLRQTCRPPVIYRQNQKRTCRERGATGTWEGAAASRVRYAGRGRRKRQLSTAENIFDVGRRRQYKWTPVRGSVQLRWFNTDGLGERKTCE